MTRIERDDQFRDRVWNVIAWVVIWACGFWVGYAVACWIIRASP